MKESNNFNQEIDKYYDKKINENDLKQKEFKDCLDRMNVIEDLEKEIPMKIDISSIVENGQEIRAKKRLRQETLKFSIIAGVMAVFAGALALKTSLIWLFALQFIVLIVLLIINIISFNKNVRSES